MFLLCFSFSLLPTKRISCVENIEETIENPPSKVDCWLESRDDVHLPSSTRKKRKPVVVPMQRRVLFWLNVKDKMRVLRESAGLEMLSFSIYEQKR